ncbi:MAG: hypothetical protein EBX52_06610 [Proteobacteria bacterium]|nr:hypothetical protein [Pseudomonadota bacterium]
MKPEESKIFLRFLVLTGFAWIALAGALFGWNGSEFRSFLAAFWMVVLDLGVLIFLFWQLFFSSHQGLVRKMRVMIAFTFKLVCLAFLAITLKRLRNDPHFPVALAVLFMGAGPLLSAITAKVWIRSTQG